MTEEKIIQIKKKLKNGMPEGEIRNDLKKEGYSAEEINEIFRPKPYDMRSWYLVSGILFFTVGCWAFLRYGSLLLLIASAIMISLYYNEVQKKKKDASQ
jgi:hypothetical protein